MPHKGTAFCFLGKSHPLKTCSRCHTALPDEARFCFTCGAKVEEIRKDPASPGPQEIAGLFFERLSHVVRTEQDPGRHEVYLQRFRESEFQRTFDIRMEQLAEEVKDLRPKDIDARLEQGLEDLCDFFIIHYCKDLNAVFIPEAALAYQGGEPDLFRMVMDFLHFESEPETVFTNLLDMPVEKLRNASKSFLFPDKNEPIFFICNLSLLGSCKEGFAMTDRALYWKAPLEKARKIPYADLVEVVIEKDWLRINGLFFHASKTLDVRLLKLLRRLQRLAA